MSISLKKITSQPELETIRELYHSAFPADERREFTQLQELLHQPHCAINQVIYLDEVAGFCIYWPFDDFVFLEHFAILPELRGQKIGEKVLTFFKSSFQIPLMLEVEPATDSFSERRIQFYERNGFFMLPIKYKQPSYDGIKPSLDMHLMSNTEVLSPEKIKAFVNQIYSRVYGHGS